MTLSLKKNNTYILKSKAHELGFDFVSVSKAEELTEEARKLEQWLNQGLHGKMSYMANHFDKRIDPRKLVDGAKSVVSLLFNYQMLLKFTRINENCSAKFLTDARNASC